MRWKDIIQDHMYLDDNGILRWKNDGYFNRYKKDDPVKGYESPNEYLLVRVPRQRSNIFMHHVVLILAGITIEDDLEVDHLDGDRKNNSLSNLRLVSRRQNSCNRKKRSDNTSGITGIRWSDYHQHYVIRRTVGNTRISTSRKTLPEALATLSRITTDPDYTDRHGK